MNKPLELAQSPLRALLSAAVRALTLLADLRSLFRAAPHHTHDEQRAIRALASLHPAFPRKVARLRARAVDRSPSSNDAVVATREPLYLESEHEQCVRNLRDHGVHVFRERLPQSVVASLQRSLQELPAFLRNEEGKEIRFRPETDRSGLFDIHEQDLMSDHAVQDYVTHPTWHAVASRYFDAPPVHDETVAWWTFPQSAEYASLSAQLFHSDRRRLSFLKFFTYLTDVTAENGPHVVVPGTHRRRSFGLRPDRRYEDAEIAAGCEAAPLEALGPAGTVVAVDTQALHKGKRLDAGHRLVLEIQFATDLLGPPSLTLHSDWSGVTKSRIRANPRIFQRFKLDARPADVRHSAP
jgi:Phytanoyl-CoA dioxygenase (PhyH)